MRGSAGYGAAAVGSGRLTEIALCYQRALERNPQQPEALLGMSLVALSSRQTEAAVKMAYAGVAAAPKMGAAWVVLGNALKAAERMEDAEGAYAEAIRLDGMDALARMGMGELKIAMGRADEAAREFELALQRRPAMVAAHLGLGNALALMSLNEEALERYEAVLAIRPRLPEGEFAAGFALARLGRTKEAEKRYRRALVMRPDFAAAWINLGSLLREEGREAEAEAALRRAVELRPDLISGWVNLAILERDRRRTEAAEAHLRRALALNPNQVETLVAWCQLRAAERDVAGAREWMRWALARNAEFDEVVNMHGIVLHLEGRFEEAIEEFERAEELGNGAAPSNRGNSLMEMGRMREALKAQESAVAMDPASAGAEYNLALTELRLGDWERGWAGYEARWRFREVHRRPRSFKQPRWDGEELHGERVLLYAEQGLGDTIQFCRYAALVAARGGFPVLQVQPAAERLMRSLAVVHAGLAETAMMDAEGLAFDFECPLMSLPAVFGTTVETVPWTGAYLGADEDLVREKVMQLSSWRPGPRVGMAWAGNPKYKADAVRSIKLKTLLPLLRAVNANWISLQKGEAAEQIASLPDDVRVLDGSSNERDLAETAALIATLDLVITTDTCIAHLAGAMGKPVWILLPKLADWRWMEEMERTPWYPTARLFRQRAAGDWADVVERVIAELRGAWTGSGR
ncbi:MAG TPA: tetratricopeptide repeat protein [Terracidiphilus sp.]|nr:tetratricopeptide repeat protein [Terracidiphilus sp.]